MHRLGLVAAAALVLAPAASARVSLGVLGSPGHPPVPGDERPLDSYCAHTSGDARKGASHSTRSFRRAFARTYLLLHGGTAEYLDARLRRLGLPGVTHDYERNSFPTLRVMWNTRRVTAAKPP